MPSNLVLYCGDLLTLRLYCSVHIVCSHQTISLCIKYLIPSSFSLLFFFSHKYQTYIIYICICNSVLDVVDKANIEALRSHLSTHEFPNGAQDIVDAEVAESGFLALTSLLSSSRLLLRLPI